MRNRLGTANVIALLAAAGIATTCTANAANNESNNPRTGALKVTEHTAKVHLADKKADSSKDSKSAGKDSACGKGSCGTDESGAKAATDKHAKKSTKAAKSTPKTERKKDAK